MSGIKQFDPSEIDVDIDLTPAAVTHFKRMIGDQNALRLAVKQSGCSGFAYVTEPMDQPVDGHHERKYDGLTVYIDLASVPYMKGMVIDYQSFGLGQAKIIFNNPLQSASCGCGESFSVDESKGDAT